MIRIGLVALVLPIPGQPIDGYRSASAPPSRLSGESGITPLSDTEWRLSRLALVQHVMEGFTEIIPAVETELTPLYEADRLTGYRVGSTQRCPLFSDLGLRDGDVIRAINGEPLASLYEMYLKLRVLDQADVQIERRGRLLTLRYRVE